jgi:hypothetical protein
MPRLICHAPQAIVETLHCVHGTEMDSDGGINIAGPRFFRCFLQRLTPAPYLYGDAAMARRSGGYEHLEGVWAPTV